AKLSYADNRAQFSITGLPKGLQIAGSVHGVHAIENVLKDAEHTAQNAIRSIQENTQFDDELSFIEASVNFPWPMFEHPKGKEFVDFDEDLQIRDIINATKSGYRDVQLVKRFSTVGMGPSQGRHSALPTARLVA